jgi:putative hemolysin
MDDVGLSAVVVLVLIVLSGCFSAAEMALVSLSEGQLRTMEQGTARQRRVAALARRPNRFFSAVQIGSVVAGFFSAAYGATQIGEALSPSLRDLGLGEETAQTFAVLGVTLVITYLALVLAELTPRRIALQRSERIAMSLGPIIDRMASLLRPVIKLLSLSTNAVVRLLGGDPAAGREQMTVAELRELVTGHEELGPHERRIVTDVFRAGERRVGEILRPRRDVDFLEASLTLGEVVPVVAERRHTRYPVMDGTRDRVVGFVHVMDLVEPLQRDHRSTVGSHAREILALPTTQPVLSALEEMQRATAQMAVVVDEFGGTAGIVTMEDLVEQLVGDIHDEFHEAGPPLLADAEQWTVVGRTPVSTLEQLTGTSLPRGPYETIAGLLMDRLGHVPSEGAHLDVAGLRLTVVGVDGHRVESIRVEQLAAVEDGD